MLPKIGIVGKQHIGNIDGAWNDYTVTSGKINYLVVNNGGVPISITPVTMPENLNKEDSHDEYELTPEEKEKIDIQIDGLDGIILQGGMQTCSYEEYIAKRAMEKGIPIMGICAGFNVIIRAAGGEVIHNESGSHDKNPNEFAHSITIDPTSNLYKLMDCDEEIEVNSVHWMIAKEEGVPQDVLKIVAHSPDGLVEAYEGVNGPIYGYKFHPEVMATEGAGCYNPKMNNIFKDFVEKCLEYKRNIDKQSEIEELRKEVELLKDKNNKLNSMLKKALDFAEEVSKSRFARIFFRKKLQGLPKLDDSEREIL